MSDSLKQTITSAMKDAMRAQDKDRLGTIRMALAAIKQKEVDERITPSDVQIIDILNKMVKQRLDAAKQYHEAGREELQEKELSEIKHIEVFLPEKLSEAEIDELIKGAIAAISGEVSMRDMGKIMGQLKTKIAGRADMGVISKKIKEQLS